MQGRPPLRSASPQADGQRSGQRQKRIIEGVADAAVKPEVGFIHGRGHLYDQEQKQRCNQRNRGPVRIQQPAKRRGNQRRAAGNQRREQNAGRQEIQILIKHPRLDAAEEGGGIVALPCLAGAEHVAPRLAHRLRHAAGIGPYVVNAHGKAEIVVERVVVHGQRVEREQAENEGAHAQARDQADGKLFIHQRFPPLPRSGWPPCRNRPPGRAARRIPRPARSGRP